MDLETHSVTEAVTEILVVTSPRREGSPRHAVNDLAVDSGLYRLDSVEVRVVNRVVELLLLRRYCSDGEGAGHIAVVAVHDRAEIQRQEVAFLELLISGDACGDAEFTPEAAIVSNERSSAPRSIM